MLAKMPTHLILEENPGLIGLANMPVKGASASHK
jgi:glucokinase